MGEGYRFSLPGLAWRTVRHTFDYSSRSTRTEAVAWYVLSMILAILAAAITWWLYPTAGDLDLMRIYQAVLLVPTIALFARRLNDQGRTRWWMLLLPLAAIDTVAKSLPRWQTYDDFSVLTAGATFAGVAGVFLFFFLLPGDPGPNRAGANPRLG